MLRRALGGLSLAAALCPAAQSREMPESLRIGILVLDENLRPIPKLQVAGSFTRSTGGDGLFGTRSDTQVPFDCETDAAGECSLTVPLAYGVQVKTRHFRALEGKLLKLGLPGMQQLGTVLHKQILADDAHDGKVKFHIYTDKTGARAGRFHKMAAPGAIAAALEEVALPDGRRVLASTAAFAFWNTRPQYTHDNRGQLTAIHDPKTGATQFRLLATVTQAVDSPLLAMLSGKTAHASYKAGGATVTLSGHRAKQVESMLGGRDAVTQTLVFDLTEAQLRALLDGYREGSDEVFSFITGAEHGGVEVAIPLMEVAAFVLRVDQDRKSRAL